MLGSHMPRSLTKGDAVGLSRMPNSSAENGKRETTRVRSGINNRMMTGNPTAANMTRTTDSSIQCPHGGMTGGHTNRLCDRKGRTEGDELYSDEEKDARFAHAAEWLA